MPYGLDGAKVWTLTSTGPPTTTAIPRTVTCLPAGEVMYTRLRPRTTSAALAAEPLRYTVVPAGKSLCSPSASVLGQPSFTGPVQTLRLRGVRTVHMMALTSPEATDPAGGSLESASRVGGVLGQGTAGRVEVEHLEHYGR